MSLLIFGKAVTRRKIADKVKMNRSHFNRPIQLANLTPDIVKREVLYFYWHGFCYCNCWRLKIVITEGETK